MVKVKMWGAMPYVTKDELAQLISDFPAHQLKGRSGQPAAEPTVMRAAIAHSVDLKHAAPYIPAKDLARVRTKYRSLPDLYWEGDAERVVTPERFPNGQQGMEDRVSPACATWHWPKGRGNHYKGLQA